MFQISESQSSYLVNFHIKYSHKHIKWIQFIQNQFDFCPKMVFIQNNHTVIFIEHEKYAQMIRELQEFIKNNRNSFETHLRLIPYTSDLVLLLKGWFSNIKDLKISIEENHSTNFCTIFLQPPKNLRQFVIGQNGSEIKMLTHFLNQYVNTAFKFKILIK